MKNVFLIVTMLVAASATMAGPKCENAHQVINQKAHIIKPALEKHPMLKDMVNRLKDAAQKNDEDTCEKIVERVHQVIERLHQNKN